ncbi:uncharacterized protein LOC128855955 isoform X1 [Anastrepha ludens]|uniref:uncharacterized protein LOC128855955 isoform X1 n=1 Tax=Anastrepha ludens TaxID=28586 RepID=UPI0023AFD533|nr:uncharacterized protein LOC128855955 isoform X1 [Anastrepha ludens]
MSSSKECTTQICQYQSLGQRYTGSKRPDLELTLREYGKDSVEIELTNLRYTTQKRKQIKHICMLITMYVVYSILKSKSCLLFKGHILCDFSFLFWLIYRLFGLFSLIQTEKILFCLDLALQCHTVRFLSRTLNLFIPANSIYDVVINEVIENMDVHYILIIRTKGDIFQKKPIIALFNSLHPSFECLHMVYKSLNKIRQQSSPI